MLELEAVFLLVPLPQSLTDKGAIRPFLENAMIALPTKNALMNITARPFGQTITTISLGVVKGHTNPRTPEYIRLVVNYHVHGDPVRYLNYLVITCKPENQSCFPAGLYLLHFLKLLFTQFPSLFVKLEHNGELVLKRVTIDRRRRRRRRC
jgi:hypothetical protein